MPSSSRPHRIAALQRSAAKPPLVQGSAARFSRLVLAWAGVGLLVACAEMPTLGGGAKPAAAPASAAGKAEPSAAASAPAVQVRPEAAGEPAAPAHPLPTISAAEIPKAVNSARDLLEAGQEEHAEALLRQVLQADPEHKPAQFFLKQITDDPATVMGRGRDSFSYRVQPGESLSRIAKTFLNDQHLFYALARFNGIKVPRLVAGGQMIKVPGKAPAVSAPAAPPPDKPPAPPPTPPAPTPPPKPPVPVNPPPSAASAAADAAAKAERERAEAITRQTRAARSAFAKQDLDGAIAAWDKVLALEPGNRTALLERQKAAELRERIKKVPAPAR